MAASLKERAAHGQRAPCSPTLRAWQNPVARLSKAFASSTSPASSPAPCAPRSCRTWAPRSSRSRTPTAATTRARAPARAGRRREPLLHDLQSRQEERGARLHQARRPGDRAQAARAGRRAGREFPAGRAEEVRLRLRQPAREVPAADLPLDLGLRPERAAVGPAGLRSRAAGRIGHDERQRRGQRRGAAARHRHRRHHDGDPFGGGDQRGAASAHRHRPRPARRPRALRHRAGQPRQPGLVLPDRRRAAAAGRQRPFCLGAQQLVRDRQRQDLHGGRQPEAVHRHRQGARPSRVGRPIRASPRSPTGSPTSPS